MTSSRMEENLTETAEEQDVDDGDATKRVPVTESIRYRKRAQSAERKAQTLAEQLAEADRRIAQMSRELSDLQIEQKLVQKLAAVGATDLEAAVLITKTRMTGGDDADIDGCIKQLRREKVHLFGGSSERMTLRKTAGAKERGRQTGTALEQAAKQAARTGNRTDLQHYLKLRRNLL